MTNHKDRNFDDIANTFANNIYGTTKGRIRQAIIWQDIESILALLPKNRPLKILDAGGGQGQIACRLAQLGHQVVLCDISENMLDMAKQQAKMLNLDMQFIHSDIQQLINLLDEQFDIVICHAVLEWVSEPQTILSILSSYLKKDGVLSLMFYNYHGLLFRTVTLGNFGYVGTGLNKRKRKTLSPDYPRKPEEVYYWLQDLKLNIIQKTGVRLFHDYMIDKTKQQDRFDELLAVEQQYCHQEPYISFARYIHVVAKKQNQ